MKAGGIGEVGAVQTPQSSACGCGAVHIITDEREHTMKITIDGPAGSGKSSVARAVSLKFKIPYLETGLAYRAVGYLVIKKFGKVESISWEQIKTLLPLLKIVPEVGRTRIFVEGREIEKELKSEDVGNMASVIGTIAEFREYINEVFRKLLKNSSGVIEGRDAGTNIFPDADIKIFITASPEERAKRRYKQLRSIGIDVSYEEILKKIKERDERDMKREKYPFRPAPDAIVIDTTNLSEEEVIKKVMDIVNKVWKESQT